MRFSRFEDWEPYYLRILDHFSFDRARDEEAAVLLSSLLSRDDLPLLAGLIGGRPATVCGNGPSLTEELDRIKGHSHRRGRGSQPALRPGHSPRCHRHGPRRCYGCLHRYEQRQARLSSSTPTGTTWTSSAAGFPVSPGPLSGTTQSRPFDSIHNFGGFSDGDRAVFLAEALGASEVAIRGLRPGRSHRGAGEAGRAPLRPGAPQARRP